MMIFTRNSKVKTAVATFVAATIFHDTLLAEEQDMQLQRPELPYTISLHATDMLLDLNINGAPLIKHGGYSEVLFSFGIGSYLQTGENIIEINYEPYNLEEQTYIPHSGVKLQLQLSREPYVGLQDDRAASVHLFSGQYDTDGGDLLANPDGQSVFGEGDLITSQSGLVAPGVYQITAGKIYFANGESGDTTRRISIPLSIDDTYLPTPPWLNGRVLSDNPTMRRTLYEAYREIHQSLLNKNSAAYVASLETLFSHMALNSGYTSGEEMGEAVVASPHSFWQRGFQVAPLPEISEFLAAPLAFGTNNRMVRLEDSPLRFIDDDGNTTSVLKFFFCELETGKFEVCYQDNIPYRG